MSAVRAPVPVTLVNADLGGRRLASLRIRGARIEGLEATPTGADLVVDLRGDRVLPGLINAHDHLQLNSFPALDYPGYYRNSAEWITDFNVRLRGDPAVKASAATPRAHRLLAGGLKNLLSGVTTVAHHDPLDALLLEAAFPTRVVREFGWSHSLYVDGAERVRHRVRAHTTRPAVDRACRRGCRRPGACEEFCQQLAALGCLRPNTLLVHALGLDGLQRQRLAAAGAGVIWCPSSNLRLFGRSAEVGDLIAAGRVALGTDSRLTGAPDLLAEVKVARDCLPLDERALERIVTSDAARLLRLPDHGVLQSGAHADLLVLPAGMALSEATRADLRLVILDGVVRYGDADCVGALMPASDFTEVQVDGRGKLLQRQLAAALVSGQVHEPGVSVARTAARAAACA